MSKKINISKFISDKRLNKIESIIEKSANTDDAYDKIENLLIDDFTVKDLGTNRLILINNKNNKYICKIAGDSHGIEANYREFYNGDLDEKRITKSYSISDNGVFLVQEKVTPFTSETMKKYKKDVRKMLKHLEDKLLLVDCKLSNFKNFGIRKNGDIVLLDHGDTVPLTMYKNGKVVNIMEETNVSLRCKEYKKGTLGSKNPKPCGGKLSYSKNYDYFICEKCGAKMSIHDAYKEFYSYSRKSSDYDGKLFNHFQDGFDPEEYEKEVNNSIRQYAKDTMDNIKKKEEKKMMKKQINGHKCQQIKGYWLPVDSDKKFASIKLISVKKGDISPIDYLKFLNLNPDDYKMDSEDHKASREEKKNNDIFMTDVVNRLVDYVKTNISSRNIKTIKFSDSEDVRRNGIFYILPIDEANDSISDYDVRNNIYYIQKYLKYNDDIRYAFFDKDNIYIKFNRDVIKPFNESSIVEEEVKEEPVVETVEETNNNNDVTIIPFEEFMHFDISSFNNEDCIKYKGYYIPLSIVNKYYDKGVFKLINPEDMLKDNGYDSIKYLDKSDIKIDIVSKSDYDDSLEDDQEDEYNSIIDCKDYFIKDLIDILDSNTNGYNKYGYSTISYSDMLKLFEKYNLNPDIYLENGKLTDFAIDEIKRCSDDIEDVADYCAIDSYEILVNSRIPEIDISESAISEFISAVNDNDDELTINNIYNTNIINILNNIIDRDSLSDYDSNMINIAFSAIEFLHDNHINIESDSLEHIISLRDYLEYFINSSETSVESKMQECANNEIVKFAKKFIDDLCVSDAFEYIKYQYMSKLDDNMKYLINNRRTFIKPDSQTENKEDEVSIENKEDYDAMKIIAKNSIKSLNIVELDISDIKDTIFKVHFNDDETNAIATINLYSILMTKFNIDNE